MNDFLVPSSQNTLGMSEIESRQLAEMKSKIFLAKQFPRDEEAARKRIMNACKSKKLAEQATYSFKRGTSEVKGASVRLAEVIAQHWGNFTSGITELEQRDGESTVKAYAWDLETNFSDEKVFTVKHERTSSGKTYKLKDSRDVYEMVANQGARRKRACVFAVIPQYIVEEAVEACEKTLVNELTGKDKKTIEETRQDMLNAFIKLDERITKEHLETVTNKEFSKFGPKDIVKLRSLYNAVKEGFVKTGEIFGFDQPGSTAEMNEEEHEALEQLNLELGGGNEAKQG